MGMLEVVRRSEELQQIDRDEILRLREWKLERDVVSFAIEEVSIANEATGSQFQIPDVTPDDVSRQMSRYYDAISNLVELDEATKIRLLNDAFREILFTTDYFDEWKDVGLAAYVNKEGKVVGPKPPAAIHYLNRKPQSLEEWFRQMEWKLEYRALKYRKSRLSGAEYLPEVNRVLIDDDENDLSPTAMLTNLLSHRPLLGKTGMKMDQDLVHALQHKSLQRPWLRLLRYYQFI